MTAPTSIIPSVKRQLQELAASHIVQDYQDYRTEVITDGDATDKRQLMEIQMRLTGVEMEKKSGLYDGLAVFHFHMASDAAPMELEAVAAPEPTKPDPWPFRDVIEAPAASAAPQEAPVTAESLLESLDDMLAGAVPLDD